MFGLQPVHMIFIVVVALLIFGPSRFGEMGRSLGTTIREFRTASKEPAKNEEEKSKADQRKVKLLCDTP